MPAPDQPFWRSGQNKTVVGAATAPAQNCAPRNQQGDIGMSTLRLGDTAPDFTQESTAGPIPFHQWAADSGVFLFPHPADSTPVCTTELGKTAALATEFARRKTRPIAVSVDPVDAHQR